MEMLKKIQEMGKLAETLATQDIAKFSLHSRTFTTKDEQVLPMSETAELLLKQTIKYIELENQGYVLSTAKKLLADGMVKLLTTIQEEIIPAIKGESNGGTTK
jgi:hypothetical protein